MLVEDDVEAEDFEAEMSVARCSVQVVGKEWLYGNHSLDHQVLNSAHYFLVIDTLVIEGCL